MSAMMACRWSLRRRRGGMRAAAALVHGAVLAVLGETLQLACAGEGARGAWRPGLRVEEDLLHGAELGYAAVRDDGDAGSRCVDDAHLVRDDDDGDAEAAVEVAQQFKDARWWWGRGRWWPAAEQDLGGSWRAPWRWRRAASGRRRAARAGPALSPTSAPAAPAPFFAGLPFSGRREFGGEATFMRGAALHEQVEALEYHADVSAWRGAAPCRSGGSFAPLTVTEPAVGRSSRFMQRTRVDLPAPERPMMPKISPPRC